jgi:hypothetical protein
MQVQSVVAECYCFNCCAMFAEGLVQKSMCRTSIMLLILLMPHCALQCVLVA